MSGPYLKVRRLSASYGSDPVIYNIGFDMGPGELVGIVGPNGAGKSTLMKACLGLIPSEDGSIELFGKPHKKALREIGYIPQREQIDWDFPVNVYDVVMMGRYPKLGLFRWPKEIDRKCVENCLKKVGMWDLREQQIGELSGGQQQRVFMARALAQESQLYFMDEPFSGVDAATESKIIDVLRRMREEGKSALVIHHDLSKVESYFDKVLILNEQVIAFGPPSEVFNVEYLQVAYEGKLNIFEKSGGKG